MKNINVKWLGHSCFRLEYGDFSLVVDPFEDGSVDGIGNVQETADAVFCSHGHGDHSAADRVTLTGKAAPADFSVETVSVPHDHHNGEKRGMNTIHIFSFGGVRVVHMGDTGSVPGTEILKKLSGAAVMLIPIGGFFTIDTAEALEIIRAAAPKGVVPMHYRTDSFGFGVLATPDEFIAAFEKKTRLDGAAFDVTETGPEGVVVPVPALLK